MKHARFLILGCLMTMPLCAWGQAAAEYGLAASHSGAAAATVAGKLNADSSAAATSKMDAALNGGATKASSARPAKRAMSAPKQRAQASKPILISPVVQAPPNNRPMRISIVGGGAVAKGQDRNDKYPRVINLAPSNPGASPSKIPPK